MDPFTMLLLGSAALGGLQGAEAAKRRKQEDAFRKEVIRYRPWTQMQDPGASQSRGNILTGAVGGGITGAMLGKSLGAPGAENLFGANTTNEAALDSELSDIAEAQRLKMETPAPQPTPDTSMLNKPQGYEDDYFSQLMQTQQGTAPLRQGPLKAGLYQQLLAQKYGR